MADNKKDLESTALHSMIWNTGNIFRRCVNSWRSKSNIKEKTLEEIISSLEKNILSYIKHNKKRIVQEFYSSSNKEFSRYVMSYAQKQYHSDYFCQAYQNILPEIHSSFTNEEFIISSKFDICMIQHQEINVSNDYNINMSDKDFLKHIKNNCLIRPLYFSFLYSSETFTNKKSLYSIYDKLINESKLLYEKSFDNEEKINILIQSQMNAFTNYLKTVVNIIDNEDFINTEYFLSPYKNIYFDTDFTYTISEVPFGNDEETRIISQKNNEVKKYAEQKEIEDCNILINELVQTRKKIANIINNYKKLGQNITPYFSLIMEYFFVPYWGLNEYKFETFYDDKTGVLCVDIQIPSEAFAPKNYEIKTILKRTGEVRYKTFTDKQFVKAYDDFTYQYVLSLLYFIFKFDYNKKITSICLNGIKSHLDKSDGNQKESCILSIHTTRERFEQINLANVDAKSCFKSLKGIAGIDFTNITPVAPLIQFNKEDKRFVEGYNVTTQINEGTNLASMDWKDFENLIRDIFEKEFARDGGEVKVTQASRDGGVDAIAFDPDPIRGGKIVIQAKRYTNVVGVSAVRDLYGTVLNEGATKGILVTTSNFGPDAHEFAKNKPLTLLSGNNLLYLLEKHGYKARIDIKEARKLLGLAENTRNNS